MAFDLTNFETATWLNPPPETRVQEDGLFFVTAHETDFWQSTFYGFTHDNGHFLYKEATGDFTCYVAFEAAYETLYDQAGIMLRVDHKNWIKAGIEHSDGATNFSAVVTKSGQSDWSVMRCPQTNSMQQVRLTRIDDAVLMHYLDADNQWQLIRLAHFPNTKQVAVGPMACTPTRAGLEVIFTRFDITAPVENPLHAPTA